MRKNNKNLILLSMVFVASLLIANVVTAKLFRTGINLFGTEIVLPGAVFCYAITFLMTDVVGEIWGKDTANMIVKGGMVAQVMATILIILTQFLPAVDLEMQASYEMLLGQNWMFVIGSLTAYLTSQSWDVWIFHKMRNSYIKKYGSTKGGRWIWNNLSTMTSQIIDTVIFITISFGIGYGWLFDPKMWSTLGGMILGQYIFKFLLALIDTPIFYLLTKEADKVKIYQ